jgi:hypothetical protein
MNLHAHASRNKRMGLSLTERNQCHLGRNFQRRACRSMMLQYLPKGLHLAARWCIEMQGPGIRMSTRGEYGLLVVNIIGWSCCLALCCTHHCRDWANLRYRSTEDSAQATCKCRSTRARFTISSPAVSHFHATPIGSRLGGALKLRSMDRRHFIPSERSPT